MSDDIVEQIDSLHKPPLALKCPGCGAEFDGSIGSQLADHSTLRAALHPGEGERLTMKTVGDFLANLQGLMSAVARDHGTRSTCLLTEIKMLPDFGVEVAFMVARPKKKGRK